MEKTKEEIMEILFQHSVILVDGGHNWKAVPDEFFERVADDILQPKIYTWKRKK